MPEITNKDPEVGQNGNTQKSFAIDSSLTAMNFEESDKGWIVKRWLEEVVGVSANNGGVRWRIVGGGLLFCHCDSYLLGRRLIDSLDKSPADRLEVVIFLEGNDSLSYERGILRMPSSLLSASNPMQAIEPASQSRSRFVREYPAKFQEIDGTVYIHQIDKDRTFPILEVRPDIGPLRLNKPDCVGKPLGYLDPVISLPRLEMISKALETGLPQTAYYSYDDRQIGARFFFKMHLEFLWEYQIKDEFALRIIDDPDRARSTSWQRELFIHRTEYAASQR